MEKENQFERISPIWTHVCSFNITWNFFSIYSCIFSSVVFFLANMWRAKSSILPYKNGERMSIYRQILSFRIHNPYCCCQFNGVEKLQFYFCIVCVRDTYAHPTCCMYIHCCWPYREWICQINVLTYSAYVPSKCYSLMWMNKIYIFQIRAHACRMPN